MKLTTRVKLLPPPEQASALEVTLRACNAAAIEVATLARKIGCYRNRLPGPAQGRHGVAGRRV